MPNTKANSHDSMRKDVLVVIGAGGIGQAIARRQGAGKAVLLADFDEGTLDAAAKGLAATGYTVTTQHVDVSSRESVHSLASTAAGLGHVVQIAHTAGLSPNMAPPDKILAVDLFGVAIVLEVFGHVVASGGAGKARYIGASSIYAWQFAKALFTADLHGWTRFVSMQPQYNLIYREEEREMLALCKDQKIGVISWSPLARGNLARKPSKERNNTPRQQTDVMGKRFYPDEDLVIAQKVSDMAKARGVPMAAVALAWLLSKSVITSPIIGATKMNHLEDAVAAVSIKLTPEEIQQLEEIYIPHPVLGYS